MTWAIACRVSATRLEADSLMGISSIRMAGEISGLTLVMRRSCVGRCMAATDYRIH